MRNKTYLYIIIVAAFILFLFVCCLIFNREQERSDPNRNRVVDSGYYGLPSPTPKSSVTIEDNYAESWIPTPSPTSRPKLSEPASAGVKKTKQKAKKSNVAASAPELSSFPEIYAGDKVALPAGYGMFTVPTGMKAKVYSSPTGTGSATCGSPIVPPCKLEWPSSGGVIRVELEWAAVALASASVLTPETIRQAFVLRGWPEVYYTGETVDGFTLGVGKRAVYLPADSRDPRLCSSGVGADPCTVPLSNNKVLHLGNCYANHPDPSTPHPAIEPTCTDQMERDYQSATSAVLPTLTPQELNVSRMTRGLGQIYFGVEEGPTGTVPEGKLLIVNNTKSHLTQCWKEVPCQDCISAIPTHNVPDITCNEDRLRYR
jgi:hypothetical protein